MQKIISLKILPLTLAATPDFKLLLAREAGVPEKKITGYLIKKKSLDARGREVMYVLQFLVFIDESPEQEKTTFNFPDVSHAERTVIIIGGGPAGLFAALRLIELGIKPLIIERGKDVRSRRRDLAVLNKSGVVNEESNYCFGEGGAGTYSDGKLYTRSSKRGDIDRILSLFIYFGAPAEIRYEAHPHIGTNKLPQIITDMRKRIEACGGQVIFEKKFVDFILEGDNISALKTQDGDQMKADAYILATGHSARDIFELLQKKKIVIEAKPFALGVRVEHPQELINSIQYQHSHSPDLPPAAYSLVQQINGGGVFSFCMCPGGIIAPAATSPGELVVNGWSPSRRNNPFANSGMVVQTEKKDVLDFFKTLEDAPRTHEDDPLLFMKFQQYVEMKSFTAGGGKFTAPAQRMTDFTNGKLSPGLPSSSYIPGLKSADLSGVLPPFIYQALALAFPLFGKKMKGYFSAESNVVATESRTSSPVRIPRDKEGLHHPQIYNLYPCAEGAGFAGGIVSAAMDGERIANILAEKWKQV